ncbi:MAG: histidine kinase [Breznakibacter sp.]
MVLKILLGITIVLHLVAVSIAMRLTRMTKFNLSWMLISAALVFMAVRHFLEMVPLVTGIGIDNFKTLFVWLGIATSLFLAVGVFLIGKIFRYMHDAELRKRDYEKRLLTAVIETEERERKRFAGDLHDGLGPVLSSIKLSLSALRYDTPEKHKAEVLANVDLMVNEAIRNIREISDNLSPHVLTNFGIEKALKNFIHKIQIAGKFNIEYDFAIEGKRFAPNIEAVVYRVACELVNNTYKHSGATHAKCAIYLEDGALVLAYQDNGKGFEAGISIEKNDFSGIGVYNIFSRVESLKGMVRFDEKREKGIFVTIQIPVNDV